MKTKLEKIINAPLIRIILGFVVIMTFMLTFKELLRIFENYGETKPWQFLLRASINIGIYWLMFKMLEKRKVTEISLNKFHLNGLLSLIMGFTLISIVVLILLLNGNYSILSINKEKMPCRRRTL